MSKQTRPVFDPAISYRWEPDQPFTISGTEFGFMYNAVIKEKAELLKKLQLIEILEYKLKLAVEEGVATPHVAE